MNALAAMLESIDIPAVFLILCIAAVYSLARGNFDWKAAGCDDTGKASFLRLAIPVSLLVSSWLIIYVTMQIVKTSVTWVQALDALWPFFLAYMATWSGAKVVEKLLDILAAKWVK